jgi:hypothetical protein
METKPKRNNPSSILLSQLSTQFWFSASEEYRDEAKDAVKVI